MPDPAKEIEWASGAVALGMSKSTVFARMGEDYRDEVMQSRQDASLSEAQEVETDPDDSEADPSVPPHTDEVATGKPSE
jgi:hypothetical protein